MIKIENTEVHGWKAAIRGMRNPMNSWDRMDTKFDCVDYDDFGEIPGGIGTNDLGLMKRLAHGGPVHGKYLRMINVTADIVAPLYWWSEYDTYKVGTVANSCSKMHRLFAKPFELNDFCFDKLPGYKNEVINDKYKYAARADLFKEVAAPLVDILNELRDIYLMCEEPSEKKIIWYSVIQLLPESYNQRRTVQLNYEVLRGQYKWRKDHKLDEWHAYCDWALTLPYFKDLCVEGAEDA